LFELSINLTPKNESSEEQLVIFNSLISRTIQRMRSRISIPWINQNEALPLAHTAIGEGQSYAGLVAAGGDLGVERLIEAYGKGIFPWYSASQPVLWWSPSPRMVLQTAHFKLHPSLKKTINKFNANPSCEIRIDSHFQEVIQHCAQRPRKGQNGTWIVPEMIQAYQQLHAAGVAHSVETWIDNQLVGGLYCVNLGACLFGESMFSLQSDASKIALAALVCFAKAHQMAWIDCQQNTPHLASLGASEIPRERFIQWVSRDKHLASPQWKFDSIYWQQIIKTHAV
jgi:leucyl/phenylalanyl-tRNA---protein transferase